MYDGMVSKTGSESGDSPHSYDICQNKVIGHFLKDTAPYLVPVNLNEEKEAISLQSAIKRRNLDVVISREA